MNMSFRLACLLVGLGLTASAVSAQQPLRVGDHHVAEILTPQFYSGPADETPTTVWRHELHHPGATYIAIHFVDFELAPGDRLIVSDRDGGQEYTMSGRGKMDLGTFWAQHIKGDTAVLELISETADGGYGFVIDEYVAGFVDLDGVPETDDLRAVCGAGDFENAVCYQTSHPTEYERGRAVARILYNGDAHCTGWLASSDSHLFTNEHCITSQTDANNADFEFMSEAPTCATANCALCYVGPTVISGATFIMDDAALDFALLQLAGDPAATYGYLELDDRTAVVGEEIYIVQHPAGRAKEIAIYSTHSSDQPSGLAHVFSTTEAPCSGTTYNDVGYYADTEGGSSGSPVLARSSHKVIALHHCANCPNRGVPINLIHPLVEQYLTPGPLGQVSLSATAYNCAATMGIELRDGDLIGSGTHAVSVSSSGGDTENVTLTETGPLTGVFTGSLLLSDAIVSIGDGVLQVADGVSVTVSYNDADTGSGAAAVAQDVAAIDCVAPVISSVGAGASGPVATVSFQTDEPACGAVQYGLSCGALSETVEGDCGVSSHAILFSGLDPLTTYFYAAEAEDVVGNVALEDSNGSCYAFDTPDFTFFFYDDFATTTIESVNWVAQTGGPTIDDVGIGEPTAPYALRLNGDPSGNDGVESRTINLSGKVGLQLGYAYEQTGGGESPDSGDDLIVEYLNASASWVTLATHLGGGADMSAFAQNTVDLPAGAYHAGFRFRIRVTATDGAFDDWFVDDVVIMPMPQAPPTAYSLPTVDTDEDAAVGITLTGVDPNGDPLTYVITSLPLIGGLSDPLGGAITTTPYTLAGNGAEVVYQPNPGQVGDDAFTYLVSDGIFESNTATVPIFVTAPPPVIVTMTLPDGVVEQSYGPVQLVVEHGQPTNVWSQVTDLVYAETDLGASAFAEVGVRQSDWTGDERVWEYTLPFGFPFYGNTYDSLRISSNGFLNFAYTTAQYSNSELKLIQNIRIAPLWDDLTISAGNPGEGVFIDESVAGQWTIRWAAHTANGSHPCNFAVTLYEDGDIEFHYGETNDTVTPTVGISNGNGSEYTISAHSGATSLTNANSVRFELLKDLPDGVAIDAAGVLSGTPIESGTFDAVFRVTDSLGREAQQSYSLYVAPAWVTEHDYDADGDVDLADFGGLQKCLTGDGGGPLAAGCSMFDSDGDEDVDLADFEAFSESLVGP